MWSDVTYPEEEGWVVVEEGVAVPDVRTSTDEEESGIEAPAAVANVVVVKDDDCCTTAADIDDVDDAAEEELVEKEGVLYGEISW